MVNVVLTEVNVELTAISSLLMHTGNRLEVEVSFLTSL